MRWKVSVFLHVLCHISAIFAWHRLEMLYTYSIKQCLLSYYTVVWKFWFWGEHFWKKKNWTFFLFFYVIFKILKIRDSSFVPLLILHHIIWTNWSQLKNCALGGVSCQPFFLVKIGGTWRHSDVTHGLPIMTWDLIFLRKVWNCCPKRYGKFQSEIPSISGAIRENPHGGPAGRGG